MWKSESLFLFLLLQQDQETDSGVLEAIREALEEIAYFLRNSDQILADALVSVVTDTFQRLAEILIDSLTYLFVNYPSLTSERLLDLHAEIFRLSLMVGGAFLVWIGFLHVAGRLHGVRPTVYLLTALVVGGVSPWLLDYLARFSSVVALSLRPAETGLTEIMGIWSGLVVVTIVNSSLLLAIVTVFVVRDIFLMFVAVSSPFLGLLLVFPYTRRYAASLLGAVGGFLLIGPLNMIVFRLMLTFYSTEAGELPQWIWGLGGLVLMLGIPYVVLSSGLQAAGPALSFTRGADVSRLKKLAGRSGPEQDNEMYRSEQSYRENRFTERRR